MQPARYSSCHAWRGCTRFLNHSSAPLKTQNRHALLINGTHVIVCGVLLIISASLTEVGENIVYIGRRDVQMHAYLHVCFAGLQFPTLRNWSYKIKRCAHNCPNCNVIVKPAASLVPCCDVHSLLTHSGSEGLMCHYTLCRHIRMCMRGRSTSGTTATWRAAAVLSASPGHCPSPRVSRAAAHRFHLWDGIHLPHP